MRCARCGWTGDRNELVEKSGELLLKDGYFAYLWKLGTERRYYSCPKCNLPLETARVLYGLEQERMEYVHSAITIDNPPGTTPPLKYGEVHESDNK